MFSLNRLAKRTRHFFHGRLMDQHIFFLHIPKCAGVSINRAITRYNYMHPLSLRRRSLGLSPSASLRAAELCDYPLYKFREHVLLYYMSRQDTKYLTGHYGFSERAYREFGKKYAFITILRDPVKRWISAYLYDRFKKSHHAKIHEDLNTYLKSYRGQSEGHVYVKLLGGVYDDIDFTSRQAIDRAKNNLHKFSVVGCLEYLDDFLNQFEKRFGVRLSLPKSNRSPVSQEQKRSIMTPEAEDQIREICKPDLQVYKYAVNNFVSARDLPKSF